MNATNELQNKILALSKLGKLAEFRKCGELMHGFKGFTAAEICAAADAIARGENGATVAQRLAREVSLRASRESATRERREAVVTKWRRRTAAHRRRYRSIS